MLAILDQPLDAPAHQRYRFKPLLGSSHSWALRKLKDQVSGAALLDVGAGAGWLGQVLSDSAASRLVAVEIDTRAYPTLNKHYNLVVPDLTSLSGETFNKIVLLDVLEHLPRPLDYLRELRKLLAPGGEILISVPNVAHWSVRFPLFFCGSFEYRSLGIMDGTHLQFFSRKGFLKLCRGVPECSVIELSASIEPFELALPSWAWDNIVYRSALPTRHWLARALPGLMAYQHLALLRASE
jgi:SAM-dependent methyltransferase